MAARANRNRRIIMLIIVFTFLDCVLTVAGVRMGVVCEWNPIVRAAMHTRPILTATLAFLLTCGAMVTVARLAPRSRCTRPLLAMLLTVKTVVILLHVGWVMFVLGMVR
jgi:hypothetical protein